jgi:signal transduction histidine kinase
MQVSANDIVLIVIIGTCCLFIAAAAMFTYVRLYNERKKKHFEEKKNMAVEFERQLMLAQLETQEATMSMLSKELHDNIGQLLNSTKLLIGVTQRGLPNTPDTLYTADETLGRAIQELRSLSKSLDKEWLEQFDFIENLQAELPRINAARSLRIDFEGPGKTLPLKPNEQIFLFRIVQELIQNAIKHAQATNVRIRLDLRPDILLLIIGDNGNGFSEANITGGLGIRNIRQRTQLLGGSVKWDSEEGKGTAVTIEIPLNETEQ